MTVATTVLYSSKEAATARAPGHETGRGGAGYDKLDEFLLDEFLASTPSLAR